MPKNVAKRNHAWNSNDQSDIPPRISSLHPIALPEEAPPPTPLSRMSFDQLMEVLPNLDAAIIANDWLPCMQKRQKEIKKTMQSQVDGFNSAHCISQDLNHDLLKTIDEVGSVATSFYTLFETAKALQIRDIQSKSEALEEAIDKQSEAVYALARHINVHNDKCAAYERQIADLQNGSRQAIRVLGSFIHENLTDALDNSPQEQIEEVLQTFMKFDTSTEGMSNLVSRKTYKDLQHALDKAELERNALRDICTQQMNTIHQQSREMDQYLTRMAKVISLVEEKEDVNHKLRLENDVLQEKVVSIQDEMKKQRAHHETPKNTHRDAHSVQYPRNDSVWSHNAEIANLRGKLTQALDRERNLNQQLKQLLQISHGQRQEKQPNRFKRFLTGGTSAHDHFLLFPRGSSMHDLSSTSFSENDKGANERRSPASKSDMLSPNLTTNSSRSAFEPLELPPLLDSDGAQSSIDLPPRLRTAALTSLHTHDKEIESAVSSRFQPSSNRRGERSVPMPANVRITGPTPSTSANEPWKSVSTSANLSEEKIPLVNQSGGPPQARKIGLPRSPSMLLFEPSEEHNYMQNYPRVLSGITEVSETDTIRP